MSTVFKGELAKFNITDTAIAKIAEECMPLRVKDVNDDAGYQLVRRHRLAVRDKRVDVERVRKLLKKGAIDYGRMVDNEAKRITALLEPIEEHLKAQEAIVIEHKKRLEEEARLKAEEEARRAEEAKRAEEEAERARIKAEQEAEAARLRAEREKIEAEKRAAQEKLDAERAALEAERAKAEAALEAQRQAIEAEKRKIAEAEAEKARQAEMERAKAEAAERARKETEERIAREAAAEKARAEAEEAAAKARAEAEEAARKRAEELRPDKEKLLSVAEAVRNVAIPSVSAQAAEMAEMVRGILDGAAMSIEQLVASMK